MDYKEFILAYFKAINGANLIQSGRLLFGNSSDFTRADDEIIIEDAPYNSVCSVLTTLPQ